jgi:hypothetical protein
MASIQALSMMLGSSMITRGVAALGAGIFMLLVVGANDVVCEHCTALYRGAFAGHRCRPREREGTMTLDDIRQTMVRSNPIACQYIITERKQR